MAQYTPKRKYTKKPTSTKKVIKKVKKETVETNTEILPEVKSFWQKIKSWFKGIAG